MAEEPIRHNLNTVTAEKKDEYLSLLKAAGGFTFKSYLPVTDNCHFERYGFALGKDKLGIVYDTKAQIMSFTAKNAVLQKIPFLKISDDQPKMPLKEDNREDKPPLKEDIKKPAEKNDNKGKQKKPIAKQPTPAVKKEESDNNVAAKVQANNNPRLNKKKPTKKENPEAAKAAKPKGERKDKKPNNAAAIKSLKKLLPDAFDLLSEQSKTDLCIGVADLNNAAVVLSDYSVLLVPPYRGLERFIFDLQQARSITVKMIGQAYEKDESGKHVLKQCYRRKNGIVYSEVMSALYCEYFARRNFYAHSDNTDSGTSRVIDDRNAAKSIFDKLCEVINYNGKKLKEIGFTVSPEKN